MAAKTAVMVMMMMVWKFNVYSNVQKEIMMMVVVVDDDDDDDEHL